MKNNNFEFNISNFEKLHLIAKNLPSILLNKSKEIAIPSLLEKIFVSRPYFAFDKIYQFEDILIAPINSEQLIGFESSPMSSAEASRHLAILGSCAIAMNQNDCQYYLAIKARKRAEINTIDKGIFCDSKQFYALAYPLFCNEKEAGAATILVNLEGEIIFNFMVGYKLFSERLFSRVFKPHYKPTENINFSPYREVLKFKDINIDNNILRATLPAMKPIQCAGHFDNFPILPVGILAYMAINTIGVFLNHITHNNNLRYHLVLADMDALFPTSIDQEAELAVTFLGERNDHYSFSWIMNDMQKRALNTMNISFAISHEIFNSSTVRDIKIKLSKLDQYKKMYAELAYKIYQLNKNQLTLK